MSSSPRWAPTGSRWAFLCEAYDEEIVDAEKNDKRVVLHLHPALAPFKAAVLPLSKKLGEKAREIHAALAKYFIVDYDEAGSIGKRYRRQDEIGTPFCITYDFDSENDGCVTVRDRIRCSRSGSGSRISPLIFRKRSIF